MKKEVFDSKLVPELLVFWLADLLAVAPPAISRNTRDVTFFNRCDGV
jgi:hypothetical protein